MFGPVAFAQPAPQAFTSPSEEMNGAFGAAVGGLADINDDGIADVVIGAPNESGFFQTLGAGNAYVFSGADGTVEYELVSLNEAEDGRFGGAVAGLGDVDGGADDFVVGADGEDDGAGRAYVYSSFDGTVLHTLASANPENDGQFGRAVAGVDDVDGDGYADVIVGAPQEGLVNATSGGRAYLFSGNTGSLLATFTSPSPADFGRFGSALAGLGDVSGDGVPDVLVGAEQEGAEGGGRAHVFSGADGTVLYSLDSPNSESGGAFGGAVAGLSGSVDGDDTPDLIVGARGETVDGATRAGRAYLFSGSDGTLIEPLQSPNSGQGGFFGIAVASVADGNGDGVPDALVGADGESNGAGRAYVFSGTEMTPYFDLTSPDSESDGGFGEAVAGAPRPDGRADPVVGARRENPDASPGDAGRAYAFSGSVLPVELVEFTAQSAEAGVVTLAWTTASETNNAGFAVERRPIDDAQPAAEFARIGFVNGAGTTTEPQPYRFRDSDLPAHVTRVAYRLKQIDHDGAATYSEAIEIEVGAPVRFALRSNVPNPFRNQTTIHYDLPRPGPVRLAVYDALGRRVAVLVDEAQSTGQKQVTLDGHRLASGVYMLRLEAGGRIAHRRITVVR